MEIVQLVIIGLGARLFGGMLGVGGSIIIIPAMIGGFNGSKLTHRLPVRTIKSAFLILMVLAGVRLMYKASQSIASPGPAAQLLRYDAACTVAERRVHPAVVQLQA